jgi:cell division protein FtsB
MKGNSNKERRQERYINFFWMTLTVVIAICTVVVSFSTIGDMIRTRRLRNEVEVKISALESKIAADSIFIERISNSPEFMEEYARETFHMQRPGETVYILEQ